LAQGLALVNKDKVMEEQMLNAQQKKAIRTMISIQGASAERMEQIGADDDFAFTELVQFIETRRPLLDEMFSDALGKYNRAQVDMQRIDTERVIWTEALA
jgi:hypothetical protein